MKRYLRVSAPCVERLNSDGGPGISPTERSPEYTTDMGGRGALACYARSGGFPAGPGCALHTVISKPWFPGDRTLGSSNPEGSIGTNRGLSSLGDPERTATGRVRRCVKPSLSLNGR